MEFRLISVVDCCKLELEPFANEKSSLARMQIIL